MATRFFLLKSSTLVLAVLLVPAFAATHRGNTPASASPTPAVGSREAVAAPVVGPDVDPGTGMMLPEIVVFADRIGPVSLPEVVVVAEAVGDDTDASALGTPCPERADRQVGRQKKACDVRTVPLAARDRWAVDAGENGSIRVEAWDQPTAELRVVVTAVAATEADAQRLVDAVTLETAGTVQPRLPQLRRGEAVSVQFEMRVPRASNLDLVALNGGIDITGVAGDLDFRTRNGGVRLVGVGGDVRGETTNGGLDVTLAGATWTGGGLDVRTDNGSVQVRMPERYDAEFEAGTTNGAMRLDLPGLDAGQLSRQRGGRIATTLGSGGPRVRVVTTNGAVSVTHS